MVLKSQVRIGPRNRVSGDAFLGVPKLIIRPIIGKTVPLAARIRPIRRGDHRGHHGSIQTLA
jgi:hypothetical protein